MLPVDALKDLLPQDLSDAERALLCLAAEPVGPRQVKEVRALAFASGWRKVKKKNLSAILGRAGGLAVRSDAGWELTNPGRDFVAKLAGPLLGSPVYTVASALRAHMAKLDDGDTQGFVEEAIACFEARQYRAAVVLSWVGAVSVLQHHVVDNKLSAFNAEAKARRPGWRVAKTVDDLGMINEDSFLDVLQAISVIGKNVKLELKKALSLRNGCGHPNSLKLAEHKVSAHIEDLILNVYSTF